MSNPSIPENRPRIWASLSTCVPSGSVTSSWPTGFRYAMREGGRKPSSREMMPRLVTVLPACWRKPVR